MSHPVANPSGEIFERVAGLGEDDNLAARAALWIEYQRIIEDAVELAPLGIVSGAAKYVRHSLETLQFGNLRLELGDGLRRCCAVNKPILARFQFLAGRLLEVILVQGRLGR